MVYMYMYIQRTCTLLQLRESKLELPSLKRLCVRETHLFTPLPSLVKARMTLLNMQTSVSQSHVIYAAANVIIIKGSTSRIGEWVL